MTEHAHPGTGPASDVRSTPATQEHVETGSAWLGWIWFAGAMMILLGLFNVIEGLVALFNSRFYVVGPEGLLVFDIAGWGWVHLIIGILAVAAGLALFTGAMWARVVAVVLATINALAQLTFLSAYPVWCTIVIALDVIVIWAVIAHGAEARSKVA